MYAIVDVKDKQFKVRENDTLYVPYHADVEADDTITLDRVLLLSNEAGDVTIGTPTVDGASVTARVLDHVKGDKVLVFKKKRRKRYRVKRGHRQQFTQIQIESLSANGAAPAPASDDAPASEDAPADDAPADDAPADDAPAEDAPVDEASAADAADTADATDVDPAPAEADASDATDATETDAPKTNVAESDDADDADATEADTAESDDAKSDDADADDETSKA